MPVLFKEVYATRLKREYSKLHHYNPKLCEILLKLQHLVETKFHKNIRITQIERGQEENDQIYKADKIKKNRKTAHGVWAAVDISSHDFKEKEISEIVAFLNAYNSSNSNPIKGGSTALYHKVTGCSPHSYPIRAATKTRPRRSLIGRQALKALRAILVAAVGLVFSRHPQPPSPRGC